MSGLYELLSDHDKTIVDDKIRRTLASGLSFESLAQDASMGQIREHLSNPKILQDLKDELEEWKILQQVLEREMAKNKKIPPRDPEGRKIS
jgi:hypothetical protein